MFRKIKGTTDIYGDEILIWNYIESLIKEICRTFNYKEIRTPIFEETSLFSRNIGETADIVSKEMYTFLDKGNRSITLRPEGTASVIRSVVENKTMMANPLPLKLFYYGPMFRYERPQKGRQRQFYQFGVENIGINNYRSDFEVVLLGYTLLNRLGIKKIKILLNNLGDTSDRQNYAKSLKEYFLKHENNLSSDSKSRLYKNPLRILDSKSIQDKEIIKDAPLIKEFLSEESKAQFEKVCDLLKQHNIDFEINNHLVRGLDYYSNIVFEIISTSEDAGAQNTLIGGGRYNYLIDSKDSSTISGTGFALGMERIILSLKNEKLLYEKIMSETDQKIDVFVVNVDCDFMIVSLIVNMLRNLGLKVEYDYSDKTAAKQFKKLSKLNVEYSLIIGNNDFSKKQVSIKKRGSKEETKVKINELLDFFNDKCPR